MLVHRLGIRPRYDAARPHPGSMPARPVQLTMVASTAELTGVGSSRSTIARAARAGMIHRIGHGLYAPVPAPDGLLVANRFGVLSHATAGSVHGFDLLDPPGLHVTSPNHRRSPAAGIVVHRAALSIDEVVRSAGLSMTAPLRTAIDCARSLPQDAAVVLLDSGLRTRMFSEAALRRAAESCRGPRSARIRRATALVDPLSESALETLTRLLFHAHGLHPGTQVVIDDRYGFIGRVDFLFPAAALVVEADGFEHHADRASFRRDRRRQNALVAAGYTVLRFSWEDVTARPDHVIALVRNVLAAAS